MNQWNIWLASWILEDGNYPDFKAGQIAEFALEFSPQTVAPTASSQKAFRHIKDATYQVTAEVVFLKEDAWVIDFGISAFQDSAPPKGIKQGDFIEAEIGLGIDSYAYFERLFKMPGMPALIYTWQVDKISRLTAPLIETHNDGKTRYFERDKSKWGFEEVRETKVWSNDQYILHCIKLDKPPKYDSITAT